MSLLCKKLSTLLVDQKENHSFLLVEMEKISEIRCNAFKFYIIKDINRKSKYLAAFQLNKTKYFKLSTHLQIYLRFYSNRFDLCKKLNAFDDANFSFSIVSRMLNRSNDQVFCNDRTALVDVLYSDQTYPIHLVCSMASI